MKRGVKTPQKANGAIRIISGQWRGRKLPVLDVQGLRPTTDRSKETLFNWLMPYVQNAVCLDAFAGSGGLGFEALSRYAKNAVFVELDPKVVKQLYANIDLLKIESNKVKVIHGDAATESSLADSAFDLIFLDPPFNKGLLPKIIQRIDAEHMLKDNGVVYVECEAQCVYSVPASWALLKEKNTSHLTSRLYQLK